MTFQLPDLLRYPIAKRQTGKGELEPIPSGYGVLNASFGLSGKLLEVTAYAKNLSNDHKIIQQPEVNTVFEAYTVRPRTVGITVKLHLQ